tara:strand:+ start:51 stop:203 length:153 start_codon:yes stop_codon:yes gene_type:complete
MIIEVNSPLNRRINNLIKAKDKAKDDDFKRIWNNKLHELLRKEKNNLNLQ